MRDKKCACTRVHPEFKVMSFINTQAPTSLDSLKGRMCTCRVHAHTSLEHVHVPLVSSHILIQFHHPLIWGRGKLKLPYYVMRPFCLVVSRSQDAAANAGVRSVYLTTFLYYHLQLFIALKERIYLVSIHLVSLSDLLATINL